MVPHKLSCIGGHFLSTCIVLPGPLHLLHEVTEVVSEGDIVLPGDHLAVEVLVVGGVLLEDERAPRQQVGEAVCSHRAIDVDLVLVLRERERERGLILFISN